MESSSIIFKSLQLLFLTWGLEVLGCNPVGMMQFMGPPLQETPVIRITGGKIVGRVGISRAGEKYHAFLGIPYAKAPVGKKRFKVCCFCSIIVQIYWILL